jgi:spermidine synthase
MRDGAGCGKGMAQTGTGWRGRLSGWLRAASSSTRQAWVERGLRNTELKFTGNVTQSRMRTWQPYRLLVPYTRTMMAALLWRPDAGLAAMVGLGGGSQAKFCHRYLPSMRLEVVESEAEVIAMRRRFRIPDDDARLQVFHDDGAHFLRARPGRYDVLLVDAYDPQGIPPALSTQRWYDDCRAALAPGGVMATNLFSTDIERHIERLRHSFGRRRVLLLKEPRMSNHVAFVWTGDPFHGGVADIARHEAMLPAAFRRELAPELARVTRALREMR